MSSWIEEPKKGGGGSTSLEEGVYVFTSTITPGTAISLTTPTRGTAITLPASAAAFNNNPSFEIYLNGVEQEKGTQAIWVSPTQLSLVKTVYDCNELTIRKIT